MDSEFSAKFVESLSQFLLTFFKSHPVFSYDLEVIGHVCLKIDRQTRFNFVLEEHIERVSKENINALSRTFQALRPIGHSKNKEINTSLDRSTHGSTAVEHSPSEYLSIKLEPKNYDSPIKTVSNDNSKLSSQLADSKLPYEYLSGNGSKCVQEADSGEKNDNRPEHSSSQDILQSHLHSPVTDSVLQENLNLEFLRNSSHQNKVTNVQSIEESNSSQNIEEAGASSDANVFFIEEDEMPGIYRSHPSSKGNGPILDDKLKEKILKP